ncbi:hypothetical protein AGR7C_Cc140085 [Agrobacterium deltaense Zutra 3/1]|uniref:Uncharacterized protein n=1 Tax=Agrobacterium deltaense Zutra 3/1 TaxID=1183427 RepID=A0A1S7PCL0_9HYPH|nr:hypothetical protein AGR7C_Cc140085 [Agrobacterium deltaense Zutra 3/1]
MQASCFPLKTPHPAPRRRGTRVWRRPWLACCCSCRCTGVAGRSIFPPICWLRPDSTARPFLKARTGSASASPSKFLRLMRWIISRRRDARRFRKISLRLTFPLPCPARSSLPPERRGAAYSTATCNCRSFAGNGCWQRLPSLSVSDGTDRARRRNDVDPAKPHFTQASVYMNLNRVRIVSIRES